MRPSGLLGAALVSAVICCAPETTQAQALQDKFWLQVTAYYPKIDTDVTVTPTGSATEGTNIDLERDLGLDDREILPAVFGGVRIGRRFSIGADYYSLGRETTRAIDRDLVFDGVTYPVNAEVTAEFNTDVYRLTLGYAFLRRDNIELGAALGLHATNFEVGLSGEGAAGGGGITLQTRAQDFLAPLPTIGLFGTFELAPGLSLGGRFDWLSLSIGDYDGRLINTQATLAYRVTRNVGVGIMYRYVDYRVDVEKDRFTGRFAYQFAGPAAFVEIGF